MPTTVYERKICIGQPSVRQEPAVTPEAGRRCVEAREGVVVELPQGVAVDAFLLAARIDGTRHPVGAVVVDLAGGSDQRLAVDGAAGILERLLEQPGLGPREHRVEV